MLLGANALIQVTPGLMIWTIVCFLIALFVLRKYAFGPIQKLIDDRRERIRRALDEADEARHEARELLEEHRKLIGQLRRVKEEAEADRQRRLEDTKRQIDAETRRALEEIRAEVAELSLIAAEKVTRGALDDKDQRRLIDDAIGELDFSVLERND
jgi:F-type H+-transporting ATPase subunit b